MMQRKNKIKIHYPQTTKKILSVLSKRQREVVSRRFGLAQSEPETLESIGRSHNITRERVRQIENSALCQIKESPQFGELKKVLDDCKNHINFYGGLRKESALFSELTSNSRDYPHFNFLLTLGESFERIPENKKFHAFWFCDKGATATAGKVIKFLTDKLAKHGSPLAAEEFAALRRKELSQVLGSKIEDHVLDSHLAISKEIMQGPFGHHGLCHWPEINPRSVRDKAYLVFKKENRPLHFREVAGLINKVGPVQIHTADFVNGSRGSLKQSLPAVRYYANPQTVHNELIKDNRFVLIGRGTYALKEWGYEPGVVKDIIKNVLTASPKPLGREEIIARVLKQRLVKPNTVLFNLNDKSLFQRLNGGRYALVGSA